MGAPNFNDATILFNDPAVPFNGTVPASDESVYSDTYSDHYGTAPTAGGIYSDYYSDYYGMAGTQPHPPPPPPGDIELEAKLATRLSHMVVIRSELYAIKNNKEVLVAGTGYSVDLRFTGGRVTGQRQSAVSRGFNATVIDPTGTLIPDEDSHLIDPLARPILKLWRGVKYYSRLVQKYHTMAWPIGTFVIEGCHIAEDDKGVPTVEVSGSDRSVLISANTFDEPYDIIGGPTYDQAIQQLITDRAASRFIPKFKFEVSDHVAPDMTFNIGDDGWAQAQKMAQSDGKELFVDANDTFVLRTIPDPKTAPVEWKFNEDDELGMLPGKSRDVNIQNAYNGVMCVGNAPWLLYDVRATAWDDDPNSITYYLGPFGKKPFELDDPLVANADQALLAAQKELLNRLGVMEDVSISGLPMPFLTEGMVISAQSPNIKLSAKAMIETIEMPLTHKDSMPFTLRRQRVS